MKKRGSVACLVALGLSLGRPGHAVHDPNTFDETTLNAPAGCGPFCVTTFAHGFPNNGAFGPFGILFLPSGKVLCSAINSTMFLFPDDVNGTFPACPTGPGGVLRPEPSPVRRFDGPGGSPERAGPRPAAEREDLRDG